MGGMHLHSYPGHSHRTGKSNEHSEGTSGAQSETLVQKTLVQMLLGQVPLESADAGTLSFLAAC